MHMYIPFLLENVYIVDNGKCGRAVTFLFKVNLTLAFHFTFKKSGKKCAHTSSVFSCKIFKEKPYPLSLKSVLMYTVDFT